MKMDVKEFEDFYDEINNEFINEGENDNDSRWVTKDEFINLVHKEFGN